MHTGRNKRQSFLILLLGQCGYNLTVSPVSLLSPPPHPSTPQPLPTHPQRSLAISGKDGATGGSGFSAALDPNPGFGSGMRRSGDGADTGLVGRRGGLSRLAG